MRPHPEDFTRVPAGIWAADLCGALVLIAAVVFAFFVLGIVVPQDGQQAAPSNQTTTTEN